MKVAVISDIHGNFTSLEAVVKRLELEGLDAVVSLGDVAATGPQPRETVELLMDLDYPTVMGNADAEMFRNLSVAAVGEDAKRFAEIDSWCAEQLSPDHLEYLRGFQPTVEMELGDGHDLLCFHGSPSSFDGVIPADASENELVRTFSGTRNADVFAGGHTHVQAVRRFSDTLFVNPGSVGLPVSGSGESLRNPSWAEFALVSSDDGMLGVELLRTRVDAERVRRSAFESGMPHAEWWASGWRG